MRRRLIRLGAATRHCDMCGWEQMHELVESVPLRSWVGITRRAESRRRYAVCRGCGTRHQLSGSRMHAD